MRGIGFLFSGFCVVCAALVALPIVQPDDISLRHLTPENYHYREAQRCAACKGEENRFMPRAAGVDIGVVPPALDARGWFASTHARSQSHGERVTTACAWCHAPLTPGATQDKDRAKPIPKGTWQGISCGACHPGSVPSENRLSLVASFTPGTDPADAGNYVFRDRGSGKDLNAHCRFCHHQSHELLIEAKKAMLEEGGLRCIDCHMAGYAQTGGHIERFHNFKVEANLPHSCSGGLGRASACHKGTEAAWFSENLTKVKGLRREWAP